jgi:predicted amidophosphoribosyltransferase
VTAGEEDMEIHRTELLQTPDGYLSKVDYVGLFEHGGEIRDAILQLKYEGKKQLSRSLAEMAVKELRQFDVCNNTAKTPRTWVRSVRTHCTASGISDRCASSAIVAPREQRASNRKWTRRTSCSSIICFSTTVARKERLGD